MNEIMAKMQEQEIKEQTILILMEQIEEISEEVERGYQSTVDEQTKAIHLQTKATILLGIMNLMAKS